MADIETIKCPGCGASLRHDGWASTVTCPYCSTVARIPRAEAPQPAVTLSIGTARHPLQAERDELAASLAKHQREWDARIQWGSDKAALTQQRNLALEPMRARLQKLDARISGRESSDPRVRLRALEAERREIAAYMDKVYASVEHVKRQGGFSDFIGATLVGCVPAFLFFFAASLIVTRMYTKPERFDDPSSMVWLFVGWGIALPVAWVVRVMRRRKRLAQLTAARDAVIPDCQQKLEKIEAEIEALL